MTDQQRVDLLNQVTSDDLVKFGLIPELIGRMPISVALKELTREDLISILTKPKNSITKQFEASFAMDDVELSFTDDAIAEIADIAIKQKTGARGLRAIIEKMLLDIMFEIPSIKGKKKLVITKDIVNQTKLPNVKDLLEEKAAKNPELQYLINEYYDGLLLYDVAKNNVWDVAANDTIALERFYNENKKNYKWEQPRFSGFVIHANNKADLKRAKKLLKKHQNGDWRKMVRKEINKDSIVCVVQGPYFCTSGVNKFIDYKVFKSKDKEPKNKYQFFDVVGTKLKQPKTLKHVSKEVVADYTKLLEDQWVAELRKKYTFKIYEDVLHELQ
jgi:hypothetical protein